MDNLFIEAIELRLGGIDLPLYICNDESVVEFPAVDAGYPQNSPSLYVRPYIDVLYLHKTCFYFASIKLKVKIGCKYA